MEKDSLITEEARALIGKEGEPITGEVYEKESKIWLNAKSGARTRSVKG